MNKVKNILVLLMVISAISIVVEPASAGFQAPPQTSENAITAYLQNLNLIPKYNTGSYYADAVDSSGVCNSPPPTSAYTSYNTCQIFASNTKYIKVFFDESGNTIGTSLYPHSYKVSIAGWGSKEGIIPDPYTISNGQTLSNGDKVMCWSTDSGYHCSIGAIIPVTIPNTDIGLTSKTVSLEIPQAGISDTKTYIFRGTGRVEPCPSYICASVAPTATATPAPKPNPVFIPPAISRLMSIISTWFTGLFGLSIAGGQSITATVNQPYTTQLSLAFTAPDSDCSDGSCQKKYGEWFIVDSSKNIKSESGWSAALTASPYTATATFTPLSAGKIYLIGVVVSQQYTYGATGWTMQESIETKEVQEINALVPAAPFTAPTTTGTGIIASISAWLKSMFAWLPW